VSVKEEVHKIIRHREKQHPRDIYLSAEEYAEVEKDHIQDVGILACSTCDYSGIIICMEYT
jgi:hypothetical protein